MAFRVYVENGHNFEPTSFLAEMESAGLSPNRVTFQLLINKFCQAGDIDASTVLLEHMKAQDIPINEHVFNSLILGHCRNQDFQEAR